MSENQAYEKLKATAIADLVGRISSDIQYVFEPRYVHYKEKQEQTNPLVPLSDPERTEIILNAVAMVMGQIAAAAFVADPDLSQEQVYGQMSRMVRQHGDGYHQMFLQQKETHAANHADAGQRAGRGAAGSVDVPGSEPQGSSDQNG
jgi:hypothetical protein